MVLLFKGVSIANQSWIKGLKLHKVSLTWRRMVPEIGKSSKCKARIRIKRSRSSSLSNPVSQLLIWTGKMNLQSICWPESTIQIPYINQRIKPKHKYKHTLPQPRFYRQSAPMISPPTESNQQPRKTWTDHTQQQKRLISIQQLIRISE